MQVFTVTTKYQQVSPGLAGMVQQGDTVTHEETYEIYSYEDLSDDAKEKARQWMAEVNAEGQDHIERMGDVIRSGLEEYGFALDTGEAEAWDAERGRGWFIALNAWLDSDVVLAKARELLKDRPNLYRRLLYYVQRGGDLQLGVKSQHHGGGQMSSRGVTEMSAGSTDMTDKQEEALVLLEERWENEWRRLEHQLLNDANNEYDYMYSDEVLAEDIIANEYGFDVEGKRLCLKERGGPWT